MTELVEVRRSKGRGLGLFAKVDIPRFQDLALYRVIARPFDEADEIYGVVLPTLTEESFDRVLTGVPIKDSSIYIEHEGIRLRNIAMYINEPNPDETPNADIALNRIPNLVRRGQERAKLNDIFDYYIHSLKHIKAGDEILWYYGISYKRDYI